jgi:hypothetical protein
VVHSKMNDFIDIIFRSVLVEFIGASTKWFFLLSIDFLKGKKPKSFKEIWKGEKKKSSSDSIKGGISNIFLGYAVIIALILLGFLLDRSFARK